MFRIKKLLVTMIAALLLTSYFGSTVFASELAPAEDQNVQNSTEDTINSEGQTDPEILEDGQELILKDGYYIDENGQIAYDESLITEEEVVIEEEIEEIEEEAEETKEEKEEVIKPTYSAEDLRLLTCLIYTEAGNQSYDGMLAVANVVLNRVKSNVYWHVDTVKEVIYDNKWSVQFAVTVKSKKTGLSALDKALKSYDSGKFSGSNPGASKKAMEKAKKAAKAALEGKNNIGSFLCFQNKRAANSIKSKYSDYKIIGDHIFYRTK